MLFDYVWNRRPVVSRTRACVRVCVWQTLKSWADRIDNNNRGGKIAGTGRDRKRAKVILIPSTFAVCVTYRETGWKSERRYRLKSSGVARSEEKIRATYFGKVYLYRGGNMMFLGRIV